MPEVSRTAANMVRRHLGTLKHLDIWFQDRTNPNGAFDWNIQGAVAPNLESLVLMDPPRDFIEPMLELGANITRLVILCRHLLHMNNISPTSLQLPNLQELIFYHGIFGNDQLVKINAESLETLYFHGPHVFELETSFDFPILPKLTTLIHDYGSYSLPGYLEANCKWLKVLVLQEDKTFIGITPPVVKIPNLSVLIAPANVWSLDMIKNNRNNLKTIMLKVDDPSALGRGLDSKEPNFYDSLFSYHSLVTQKLCDCEIYLNLFGSSFFLFLFFFNGNNINF